MYVCRGGRDWAGIGVHVPVRPPVISSGVSTIATEKIFSSVENAIRRGRGCANKKWRPITRKRSVCVWGEIQLTGYVAEERFRFICRDYGMAYYTVAVAVAAITLSIIKCVANVS